MHDQHGHQCETAYQIKIQVTFLFGHCLLLEIRCFDKHKARHFTTMFSSPKSSVSSSTRASWMRQRQPMRFFSAAQ